MQIRFVALGVIATACVCASFAQSHSAMDLGGLGANDWRDRFAAIDRLWADPDVMKQQNVQDALVKALEQADDIMDGRAPDTNGVGSDENYAENYLPALERAVKQIAVATDSQRAYDALVRSAYNPDSEFGKWLASQYANLPAILSLRNGLLADRVNAVALTGQMLKKSKSEAANPIAPESYREAKDMIRAAATATNDEPIVRQAAVHSLGEVGDEQDKELLRQVAQSDQARYKSKDGDRYPVREEAVKALAKLENSAK